MARRDATQLVGFRLVLLHFVVELGLLVVRLLEIRLLFLERLLRVLDRAVGGVRGRLRLVTLAFPLRREILVALPLRLLLGALAARLAALDLTRVLLEIVRDRAGVSARLALGERGHVGARLRELIDLLAEVGR